MKEKILALRAIGKSYDEIKNQLGCSKGTIAYYCGIGQKEKTINRQRQNRSLNPLLTKLIRFNDRILKMYNNKLSKSSINKIIYDKLRAFNGKSGNNMITIQQLNDKVGIHPKCYLTNVDIDLSKPYTYELDHIVPVSNGGDNSIDNLGLCTKIVNRAKGSLTKEEFIQMCKLVSKNN